VVAGTWLETEGLGGRPESLRVQRGPKKGLGHGQESGSGDYGLGASGSGARDSRFRAVLGKGDSGAMGHGKIGAKGA